MNTPNAGVFTLTTKAMNVEITKKHLEQGEYFTTKHKKNKAFIHHTAGSYRPDYTIHGWETDTNRQGNELEVATALLIGGMSTKTPDASWDGKILEAFPIDCWAYHLGMGNWMLDKTSVGIEICNYGPLTLKSNGQVVNWLGQPIPEKFVVELDKPFRGHTFYHRYTDAQMESLYKILKWLGNTREINIKKGLQEWINKESLCLPEGLSVTEQQEWLNKHGFVGRYGEPLRVDGDLGTKTRWAIDSVGKDAFEYNTQAVDGDEGVWSHTNVRDKRIDGLGQKYDCFPQKELKEVILSL